MSDGHGGSDSASVTVDITCLNEAPVADDDTVTVDEDTPTDVTSTLLANDTDANGDTLAVSDVSNAAGGSVDLTAGVVTFTPAADLCGDGEGSFDYDISDGNGGSDSASVTVDITCENDAPVAGDDTVLGHRGHADRRHGRSSWPMTPMPMATRPSITGVSNPTGGSVDLTAGVVTFTPNADLCGDGEGSFDYDISDGNGGSDSASVTVDLTCDNDAPSADDDTVDVTEDTATDVTSALLANDSDIDGDTLAVSASTNPTGGSVDLTAGVVTFTPDRRPVWRRRGFLRLRHQRRQRRQQFRARHRRHHLHERQHRPPVTNSVDVTEDTATDVTSALLANDSDIDGDTLSVSVFNPTGGSVDLTAGVVTFTPTADLCGDDAGSFDYDNE